ncbi:HlyD family efflux transporter periplasmic adaptor subunit [Mitsuaria sp. CC2]|uniref:HlyD family secretion protein n=1 Tax=Mitsuaria sp. CC2 TaxID=3029186 RepID=UPI003B8BEF0C
MQSFDSDRFTAKERGLSTPLFRQQALDAQTLSEAGPVKLADLPRFALIAMSCVAIAVGVLAFLVWGQAARKTKVKGILLPESGAVDVVSPQAGVVDRILVKEGDAVSQGDILMMVNADRMTQMGSSAASVRRAIDERRSSIEQEIGQRRINAKQRSSAVQIRLTNLEAELDKINDESGILENRIRLARSAWNRARELADSGFMPEIQAQEKQDIYLDLSARAKGLERDRLSIQRGEQDAQAEKANIATQLGTELAQLDRTLAALEQEASANAERDRVQILAPRTGEVGVMTARLGQSVQAGRVVAAVVSSTAVGKPSQLQAHLFAPGRALGFMKPGQTVWIKYDAYPHQKFGMGQGTVLQVSPTPMHPDDLPQWQAATLQHLVQSKEPFYRIEVAIGSQEISAYGDRLRLKPGMSLEADVMQESRAVWEWLFEPLLSARSAAKGIGVQ